MIDRVTLLGLAASVAGLLFVLELVRRRKLREDYSLLWLVTAAVLIVLTLSRPLLDQIAGLLGIVTYPPAAIFAVAILFMLAILLHYATVLTRLARENKQLAQQMAILQFELSETRRGIVGTGTHTVGTHNDAPALDAS
ncbi:MAG: DUF2304 domain-containing protein [Chloroflexota bacterium]|nr:DUF2304 domain-containing protein [Chloroflexota bacterium]